MRGTMFSRRPVEGRNDIRKVGTTVPVKNVRVKVRFSPAIVDDLVGEDRGEEKGEDEQVHHSWRSGMGIRRPPIVSLLYLHRKICGEKTSSVGSACHQARRSNKVMPWPCKSS